MLFVFPAKSPLVPQLRGDDSSTIVNSLLTWTEATSHVPTHPLAHWMFPLQALWVDLSIFTHYCMKSQSHTYYYTSMMFLLAWTKSFLALLSNFVVRYCICSSQSNPVLPSVEKLSCSQTPSIHDETVLYWSIWTPKPLSCTEVKPLNTSIPVSYPHSITAVIP
jgi:hypothetical protein